MAKQTITKMVKVIDRNGKAHDIEGDFVQIWAPNILVVKNGSDYVAGFSEWLKWERRYRVA